MRALRRGRGCGRTLPLLLARRHRAEPPAMGPVAAGASRTGDRPAAGKRRRDADARGMTARRTTILIAALGGEGGGLLADWLVEAAMAADLPVQSTSIPGVAQRTGATTYYLEIFPQTNAALGGKRPLFALYPTPGAVDLVAATELLEAGRMIEAGFVTPERTTLVAGIHRVYATIEKMQMGDGRFDAA